MENKLRQLQLCELEILDEFVRICEKHRLQYYLVGGTLLGAVRHQGFIPWDDDIDVAMPREDYDRFASICTEELAPQFFYQTAETDPCYFLSYAKIRKNGTEIYEERFKNAKFHKGVFIDIIPLDFCRAPGSICHFLFNILAVMNRRGEVDSGEPYTPYKEISGKLGYAVLQLFTPEQLVKARKKLLALSRRLSKGDFLASYSGAYGYYREVFPVEWFGQGTNVIFQGRQYKAPYEIELQLTQVYGDYTRLPPVTQRKGHCDLEQSRLDILEEKL